MADIFAVRDSFIAARLNASASKLITYNRTPLTLSVLATIDRTIFEITDDVGAVIRSESRDFVILSASLILNAALTQPRVGDQIVEVVGTQTNTYEVMAPGKQPAWRYSDANRNLLRIHTKLIAKA